MQVKNSNLWSLNIRYHQKLTVSRNIWPAAFKYSPDSKVLQLIRIYFHCRAVPASVQNAKYFFWNVCMRANCTEWRNPNYLTATSGWSRCRFHQRIDSRQKECSFINSQRMNTPTIYFMLVLLYAFIFMLSTLVTCSVGRVDGNPRLNRLQDDPFFGWTLCQSLQRRLTYIFHLRSILLSANGRANGCETTCAACSPHWRQHLPSAP